jgi:hypothetical protein
MTIEKEQRSLNYLYESLEDHQTQLAAMSERVLFRKNILANYVWLFYRRQKWRKSFNIMKEFCMWKRYCKRVIFPHLNYSKTVSQRCGEKIQEIQTPTDLCWLEECQVLATGRTTMPDLYCKMPD